MQTLVFNIKIQIQTLKHVLHLVVSLKSCQMLKVRV